MVIPPTGSVTIRWIADNPGGEFNVSLLLLASTAAVMADKVQHGSSTATVRLPIETDALV